MNYEYTFFIDDEFVTIKYKELREDGFPPYMLWRGEMYDVPCFKELEYWTFEGYCETPHGSRVEHDHPDSWFSILCVV